MKIALLIIATNKYYRFVKPLYKSVKKYFFPDGEQQISIFLFTDHRKVPEGCIRVYQKHAPWPEITLKRFHMFEEIRDQLLKMDYVFYCDIDMRFVHPVGKEILSKFSAAIHPYFYDTPREDLHYETNVESTAYVPPSIGKRYYCGGFFGCTADTFLKMSKTIKKNIDIDLNHGIIAKWHDESHLNFYLAKNPPEKELDPGYCYPEGENIPYEPKILALSKNHTKIRSDSLPFFRQIIMTVIHITKRYQKKKAVDV